MSSGVSQDEQVVATKPLYGAFKRELPEALQDPVEGLADAIGQLDERIAELDSVAKKQGATATAAKAAEHRKALAALDQKASKEAAAKKKDAKNIAKLTEEAIALFQLVNAELEVPIREAGMTKALEKLRTRPKPPLDKIAAFQKRASGIAGEKDPTKRCNLYFQLERDIITADHVQREAEDPGSTWPDQVELAMHDARPLGIKEKASQELASLKNMVLRRPPPDAVAPEDFAAFRVAFVNSCKKKIDDLAFSVPEDAGADFTSQANDLVQVIAGQCFANKPDDRHLLGKALVQANTLALKRLLALKRAFPPSQTPQIMVEDGKLVVVKPAPKPQSLVLQGGGSKGAGYPPMLEEMKDAGLLDNVDLLVGTSIGALNASCLACGGLADEREILDMPVFKNVYDGKNFKKQYPGVTFGHPGVHLSDVLPSCAGQMAKIDQMTSASIANNLKGQSEQALATELSTKINQLDDETLAKLGLAGASTEVIEREIKKLAKKVKNQDFKASDRTTQMITFKDLAILHQLDPVNFKELTITGWEGAGPDGHVVYFNAKDYGDMPVALAARISMGLPIFAPVYWEGRGPFYDGGLGSNTPVEATPGLDDFYQGKDPGDAEDELRGDVPVEVQEAMAKTMLMTFDDKGKGERNLFGQGRSTAAPSGMEKKLVVDADLNRDYAKALKGDATKVYNTGVNTMQVFHGDMETVSILPGKEDFEYAESMSRMRGLEQLEARSDQAAVVKCTSSDEALLGLSSVDKRNLVKAGRPSGGAPLALELYDKCVQFVALEDSFNGRGGDSAPFLGRAEASPLCAACVNDVKTLHQLYNVHIHAQSTPEALAAGIKTASDGLARCPAFLRSMMKQAVLLPMQQRQRNVPKTDAAAPTFLWQQAFTSSAFHNSMTGAEKSRLPYLKEATAVLDALKLYEKRNQEVAGQAKAKDKCAAARPALAALETFLAKLRTMAKAAAYQDNPTLQAYVRWLTDKASPEADPLRAHVKGKDVAYPQHAFVFWNRKDWDNKKDEAIDKGALEDVGSTGLGALMDKAVKVQGAGDVTAWNAWDKVIRKARAIQSQTDNANFTAYLENCVAEATRTRDRFPPP